MRKRAATKNRLRGKKHAPERGWVLTVLLMNGIIALFFAAPIFWEVWAVTTGRETYDGRLMFSLSLFGVAAVALVSWIPHLILIDDGYPPKFNHEKNTPFLFWWLVMTIGLCATLLALAPTFPLADGYRFSDTGITFTRASRSTPVALWIAAPPIWAASVLLFYFIGRGLWRHYRPAERKSGDPALRAIEALVPPLQGKLILTQEQRLDRARGAEKQRAARERRPQRGLNLPGPVMMLLWVSTILIALPLPQILMSAWPVNVRVPLGGLMFVSVAAGYATLLDHLGEPKSWLVVAGLGGMLLAAALLMAMLFGGTSLITAVYVLYGSGYLGVGLFKWVRAGKASPSRR